MYDSIIFASNLDQEKLLCVRFIVTGSILNNRKCVRAEICQKGPGVPGDAGADRYEIPEQSAGESPAPNVKGQTHIEAIFTRYI